LVLPKLPIQFSEPGLKKSLQDCHCTSAAVAEITVWQMLLESLSADEITV
jgi:hypothetical protein